ncbi:MAG: hypothetical protein ABSA83_11985 [Verrucomicrobiota bacterium]
MRTSIAIISPGFVVDKFGVWMRELAAEITSGALRKVVTQYCDAEPKKSAGAS